MQSEKTHKIFIFQKKLSEKNVSYIISNLYTGSCVRHFNSSFVSCSSMRLFKNVQDAEFLVFFS